MLDGAPEVHNTPGGLIKLMWHADWAQLSTSLLAHSVEQAVGDAVQTEVASLLFAVLAHAVVETDAADSCNAAKRKMRTGEAKTMLTSMKSRRSSAIAVYLRGRASHGSGVAAEPPRRHTSCSTAVSR